MNKVKLKYCFKCFLFWLLLLLCVTAPVIFLFLIVDKINGRPLGTDILVLLYGVLLLAFVFSTICIIKFLIDVKKQEEKYNVVFNDNNKKKVLGLTYISDDWLIDASALTVVYRKSIVHITPSWEIARGSRFFVANISTDIKKYKVTIRTETNLEKIENWAKNRN